MLNWPLIWKIIIAIVAIVIVSQFLSTLLIALFPPFGLIILVIVYLAIIGWLLGWPM